MAIKSAQTDGGVVFDARVILFRKVGKVRSMRKNEPGRGDEKKRTLDMAKLGALLTTGDVIIWEK